MSEQIQHLMREIGPLVEEIETIEQHGEQSWAVGFDDETWLTVDYAPQTDKVTLAIDCGATAEQSRLKLYETLLTYNYLWEETGGVRMALDSPGGRVVLLLDLPIHGLAAGTFATVIKNVVEKARSWRKSIEGIGNEVDASTSQPHAGLRV